MFVANWMTSKVISTAPEASLTEAISLMREKGVKHLPVMKDSKLRGIISDRDIREFSPSRATSLDVYEMHYLLAKTPVKALMKTKVITASPDMPVEQAAVLMHDNGIGCLPVMDNGKLAGIISDMDIYRVLIDITGIRHGGNRISMRIDDRPGSIKDVADIIRKHGFTLQSILTSYEKAKEGYRDVVIRTKGAGQFGALKAELMGSYIGVSIRKG